MATTSTATADANGLVTVSGIVYGPDGLPESGAGVVFGSSTSPSSATTGPDGSYVLHPPVHTSGYLAFYEPAGASPGFAMNAMVNNFGVGTADVVENFSWPTTGNIAVSVLNANGTSMPGLTVFDNGGGSVNEVLADGTPIEVEANSPPWGNQQICTSDVSGQCTFVGLVGSEPNIFANTQQVPGDLSYPQLLASANPTWTGNDGVATLKFVNLDVVTVSGIVYGPDGLSESDRKSVV